MPHQQKKGKVMVQLLETSYENHMGRHYHKLRREFIRIIVLGIVLLLVLIGFSLYFNYRDKQEREKLAEVSRTCVNEERWERKSTAEEDKEENAIVSEDYKIEGELLDDLISKNDGSANGITYSWNESGCYISGTAEKASSYTIYESENNLPAEFIPNKTYYMISNIRMKHTFVRLNWKTKDGEVIQNLFGFYNGGGEFTVPNDAKGLTIRFTVDSGSTVDGQVGFPEVYLCEEREMQVPLIVSFIDDDTTNDCYIDRYYESCKHNGIVGNYAVITSHIEKGDTSLQSLLNYSKDGFGMLAHCYSQTKNIWGSGDVELCADNLEKAFTQMSEFGFENFEYWVTPYGYHYDWCKELAERFGCKAMISTANKDYNSIYDYDRFFIKRVSLNPTDENESKTVEAVKEALDAAKMNNNAWIIITTHFNEWGNIPWDDTMDENGFAVGYERFNDVVEYAQSLGFVNMSFQDAWNYYEPILENNAELYRASKVFESFPSR